MAILSMIKMPQAPKIIQEIVRIPRREGVCRAQVSLGAPEGGPAAPPVKTGDFANPSPDIMLPPFTEDNEESLLFSPEDGELVGPPSLNLDLASLEQFLEPADSDNSQALQPAGQSGIVSRLTDQGGNSCGGSAGSRSGRGRKTKAIWSKSPRIQPREAKARPQGGGVKSG